jgi:alpha-glucosidase
LTVEAEAGQPDSMLELYRRALHIRRAEPALNDASGSAAAVSASYAEAAPMTWRSAPDGVLAFDRGQGGAGTVCCVVNLSPVPVGLPGHSALLLASGPLTDGLLPPDTAAWLRL